MNSDEVTTSRKKPLQQYAAEVFSETLVTGVPSIVNTHYWPRKIFKLCVLLFCIAGFLYQTTEFLTIVYSYPSIVDISVYTPHEYLFPAIDICNNNGIMRSKFCKKYPEKCETPANKIKFCDENPQYSRYCENETEWNEFKVPKAEFYGYAANASLNEMKELTHEEMSLFTQALNAAPGRADVKGPLIFFKNPTQYISCYTMHFRADSPQDPIKIETHPLSNLLAAVGLVVDFEPSETFQIGRKPEGIIAIHSPFEFVNPFERGIRIRPRKQYNIHLSMAEERLLPVPYETDCLNYTRKWLEEGRKGPRSQEMCKRKCVYDIYIKACNCSTKLLAYPYEGDVCFTESESCLTYEAVMEGKECLIRCKDDCEKEKFSYVVEERLIEEYDWKTEEDEKQEKAYVAIYQSDLEVVVYRHRPRYETVEVFGYIGGYIGVWLGISLVAVVDFMECLVLIVSFAFGRRK